MSATCQGDATDGFLVVGVDGGATKTLAVAMYVSQGGSQRELIGSGAAGSSNRNSVGGAAAEASLSEAVEKALALSGKEVHQVRCIVLGMSGCDRDEDVHFWQQACARLFPAAKAVVENDSVIALCSGTDGILHGIVVISGTGSIGMAVEGGNRVRAGPVPAPCSIYRAGDALASGMGPLLGDAGNGYSIGHAALAAVTRAEDGRSAVPCHILKELVLNHLGLAKVEGLIGWAYGEQSKGSGEWDRVAALAPLVFESAEQGCQTSEAILVQTGGDICELAETVAAKVGFGEAGGQEVPLVLAGGIVANPESIVAKVVQERLAKTLPSTRVVRPDASIGPAQAAACLAIHVVMLRNACPSS